MTAENLKTQRERCGFTRGETEELLCLKRGTVEKWETGKKKLGKNDAQILSAFFMRPPLQPDRKMKKNKGQT